MWNPIDLFLGVGGVAIIAATAWQSAAPSQDSSDKTLRADRVHLAHAKGTARIDIDEEGRVTFLLSKRDGGSVTVRFAPEPIFEIRQRGGDAFRMSIQQEDMARIQVGRLDHEVRLESSQSWTGFGAKTRERVIFGLGYSPKNRRHLYMSNPKGQVVVSTLCTKGGGAIVLHDSKGRQAMSFGTGDRDQSHMELTDPEGKNVFLVKSDKAGVRLDLGGAKHGAHDRWAWIPEGEIRRTPIEGKAK